MKEDELTKDDEVKIPERDHFYDVVNAMHKFEWKRFSQIESKATTTLDFLGVIFSLQLQLGYTYQKCARWLQYKLSCGFIFHFELIILITSLIFGLNSFWMRE